MGSSLGFSGVLSRFLLCAIIYTLLSYFHRPDFCASQASSNFSIELSFWYVRILAVFSYFNLVDFSVAILVTLVLRPSSFSCLSRIAWLFHTHPGRGHVGRHLVANPGPGISTAWSHGPIWPFPSLILSRQFARFSTITIRLGLSDLGRLIYFHGPCSNSLGTICFSGMEICLPIFTWKKEPFANGAPSSHPSRTIASAVTKLPAGGCFHVDSGLFSAKLVDLSLSKGEGEGDRLSLFPDPLAVLSIVHVSSAPVPNSFQMMVFSHRADPF